MGSRVIPARTQSIVSLIQARVSSSRLPGKILMKLGNSTVLDHVIHRAQEFSSQVVVCTSVDPSDDPIEAHCARQKVLCIRGSLEDVFSRFRLALLDPRVEATAWFARITGDCPLLSIPLAKALIACISEHVDYVSVDHDTLPRGLAIELIRRSVFESIPPGSLDEPEREHVTLCLYEQPGRYRCHRAATPQALAHPDLRLTLDYREDYELLQRLFRDDETVTAEQALERLLSEPRLRSINAGRLQKDPRPLCGM
jgi:spore coat polysaccharide biosynthesis protein SpsF